MGDVKRPKYRVIIIACLLFIVFLIGSLFFINSIRAQNENRISGYLEDITSQRNIAISQQIDSNFQVLRGVSTSFSEMNLSDRDRVYNILDDINKGNTFVRMGLCDINGKVDLIDLSGNIIDNVDVSNLESYKHALKGQESVSVTFFEKRTDEYVNYYMIPIYKDNEIVNILCAVDQATILEQLLDVRVFQGLGYFAVIDSYGRIVGPVVDPDPRVTLGSTVYELVDMEGKKQEAMQEALQTGSSGNFKFEMLGDEYWSVIEPLSFNNWAVISVVPRDSLNTYFNQTALGVSIIILIVSLAFILLLFFQIRTTNKNKRALEKLAYDDQLTGLRNHTKFLIDLGKLLESSDDKKYTVWALDVKGFHAVNDIFGDKAADKLLIFIAQYFNVRQTDNYFAARSAADNFIGVFPYSTEEDLVTRYEELKNELAERTVIPESDKRIDYAVGFYPVDQFTEDIVPQEMVNRATIAKRDAKETVGSQMTIFSKDMSAKLRWYSELEANAQYALDSGEIIFMIQPKVSIKNGYKIIGGEALARWNHPQHGMISPADFIPLFEKNGFIVDFDRHIFRSACTWLVRYKEKTGKKLRLAVNVSRQGLLKDDIVQYYAGIKRAMGIGDGELELEFTESIIVEDCDLFGETVLKLQEAGFLCSIDDFGSGYSSLNVLKSLPIDVLKLDSLFMKAEGEVERSKILITDFIAMAHKLKIRTVAEGVETQPQVDFLKEANCDIIQGYVFSRPVLPIEFEKLVDKDDGNIDVS